MALPCNVWSVIVGIDYYSTDPRGNLQGCVRDANNMRDFLMSKLQVPQNHITTLLAPDPSSTPPGVTFGNPSRAGILESLKDITTQAQAGDLVWFHYSGHGDRLRTKFPTLKTDTVLDEVLCAVDEDIRDVDLDDALSQLTKANLQVLAVLDSCHSGGATRDSRGLKVRCRSRSQDLDVTSSSAALRNATVRET